jgi:hypothetical protein
MDSRSVVELIALVFVVIVTAVALWRTSGRGDRHEPPADEREKERKTLSVDLRDRE